MEIIYILFILAILFWFVSSKALNKPVSQWSDEELRRRLQKYQNLLSAQMLAGDFSKTGQAKEKIDEIRIELGRREALVAQGYLDKIKARISLGKKPAIDSSIIAAADLGNSELQAIVGEAYLVGSFDLSVDLGAAHHYLKLAADGDHAHAAFLLARIYFEGAGLQCNEHIANMYARKADKLNHPDAKALTQEIRIKFPPYGSV